jgi:hypothetical protein
LLDSLRPPPGYRLGCAVGTTFSLHLDAALTAPAAFALYAVGDLREPREVEPLELLESIRRHADRFTVFFQAGQVSVPSQRRLFAYLEGAVIPVLAPNDGVFHPKVWTLRFDADDEPSSYRVLCATRNLTYDRSWDTILRLDSAPNDEADDGTTPIDPSGLAAFVRALPSLAVGPVGEHRLRDIDVLSDQLTSVRWLPPPAVRAGRFLPIGLGDPLPPPFPTAAEQVAVISPFLTAGLLKRLPTATGRRALISRPEQIVNCGGSVGERFDEVYTLDPDALPSEENGRSDDDSIVRRPAEDPNIPFEGLHAKLYVFDQGKIATVLTGSANATSAAFDRNVEFLTELSGAIGNLGVDALLAEPTKEVQTLRSFLSPFAPDDTETEDEPDDIEDALDVLRRRIASLPIEATARPADASDRFVLAFSSASALPALPTGVTWRCWPITLAPDSVRQIEPTGELDVAFAVSFEGITAFLANELQFGDVTTRFVLTAVLTEAPDNRATRLLRILLGDAERFLRYLLMLLADEAVDRYGLSDLLDAIDDAEAGSWHATPDSLPLLEVLLRTLAREPERLEHIARLITDLQADPEGGSLLPSGLLEIWEPIWLVAKELRP